MNNILVPTDFSENAYKALKYGVNLFAEEECAFHLLHTYTPSIYDSNSMLYSNHSVNDEYRLTRLKSLKKIIDRIKKDVPTKKQSFEIVLSSNLLQEEIKDQVKAKGIDLIIMGTQGATGAAKILLGTHTIKTIREAVCPVLAIPGNYKFTIPNNILFPSNFESNFSAEDLQMITDIAENFGSKVHILHVMKKGSTKSEQGEAVKALTSHFKNVSPTFHLIKDQTVQQGIFHFQKKNPVDLLVMLRHKHSFLYNLFSSPVENELGFRLTSPLFVIPVLDK